MSKSEGKKIVIKFDALILPIEIDTLNVIDLTYSIPEGVASAGYTYNSSYSPNKAFDGSTATYWRGSGAPQWIMMELSEPKKIAGFRLYSGSSSRVNGLNLFGSVDGINFELIVNTLNANSTGWKEHTFPVTQAYKYFRWETVSHHSYAAYIYELQLLFANTVMSSGNEPAFSVSGQEYKWVDGPDNNGVLVDKTYIVESVASHPTLDGKHIQLILSDTSGFNNVVGDLTVAYNQALGDLAGEGGVVASFTETFTPTDLVEKGNPRVREYISASVGGLIQMLYITKISTYETEYMSASVGGEIKMINIDDLNP